MIQDMIAGISVEADCARLLVWQAADLIERGKPFGLAASKAKYYASEAAVRAANAAIQAFGGYGYVDEYPVQKYMRDARVMTHYEGTSQIQKPLIGRAETGVSAFTERKTGGHRAAPLSLSGIDELLDEDARAIGDWFEADAVPACELPRSSAAPVSSACASRGTAASAPAMAPTRRCGHLRVGDAAER